jgi:hypothetical protein
MKRSEIVQEANRLNLDYNTYIAQLSREYPELIIEDDLSYRDSIDWENRYGTTIR